MTKESEFEPNKVAVNVSNVVPPPPPLPKKGRLFSVQALQAINFINLKRLPAIFYVLSIMISINKTDLLPDYRFMARNQLSLWISMI
jgi:hypothetical protein